MTRFQSFQRPLLSVAASLFVGALMFAAAVPVVPIA